MINDRTSAHTYIKINQNQQVSVHVHLGQLKTGQNGQNMRIRKYRVILTVSAIRKENEFLKNSGNHTDSDDLASLFHGRLIRAKSGKAILKGAM